MEQISKAINDLPVIKTTDVPEGTLVIDSLGVAEAKSAQPPAPQKILIDKFEIPGIERLSDIPELRACVMLMQERMESVRADRTKADFIRKQKLKMLQLDYARLGGRLRALVKLLSALEANPDYVECQEDMRDCVIATGQLIAELGRKHDLDIAQRCRELAPLTAEEAEERDRYEDRILAERDKARQDELVAELQGLVPDALADELEHPGESVEEAMARLMGGAGAVTFGGTEEFNALPHEMHVAGYMGSVDVPTQKLSGYLTGESTHPHDLSE
jgi:hypothetical protein